MDMPEVGEIIEMSETTEINHRQYLVEFEEKVLPIFAQRGYSKDTALIYWLLNRIENTLDHLVEVAEGSVEDNDQPFT